MADWRLEGPYMKNCNCDPGCPCDFNANPTHGNCEGMAAMIVERGHFDDVNLDGVKWAFSRPPPRQLADPQATLFVTIAAAALQSSAPPCAGQTPRRLPTRISTPSHHPHFGQGTRR